MGMLRFNDCPRCKGTVILDKDEYGWYEQCLQCGHLRKSVAERDIFWWVDSLLRTATGVSGG